MLRLSVCDAAMCSHQWFDGSLYNIDEDKEVDVDIHFEVDAKHTGLVITVGTYTALRNCNNE